MLCPTCSSKTNKINKMDVCPDCGWYEVYKKGSLSQMKHADLMNLADGLPRIAGCDHRSNVMWCFDRGGWLRVEKYQQDILEFTKQNKPLRATISEKITRWSSNVKSFIAELNFKWIR